MMLKTTQPEKVGFSTERLNWVSAVMEGYIDRGDTGGILTLVERQGEIVHLKKCGYQDVAAQKLLDFDHIFRIYSMTKPIVSLALMMLFEQAEFHLGDPIHKYLPEFRISKFGNRVENWLHRKLSQPSKIYLPILLG